jgi:transposase
MPMRSGGEPTQALPGDPAVLRALLLAAWAERDAAAAARDASAAERDAPAERNEQLKHQLRKLRRMQFGPRSERLPG